MDDGCFRDSPPRVSLAGLREEEAAFWPLALARELDDAILHLRFNEPELGIVVFRSEGDPALVLAYDDLLQRHSGDWFVREIRLLLDRMVDGLIIAASRLTRRHAAALERLRTPTVLVNCEVPDGAWPAAMSANEEGGRLATEHLLVLGHRHLGLVTVEGEAAARERAAGLDAALGEASPGTSLASEVSAAGVVAGEAAVRRLLERHPEVTGVLCYNDALALGVLRGVRATGRRVPADVSVVGFDDIDLAAVAEPPLTTIAQDIRGLGRWAVERLLDDLDRVDPGGAVGASYATVRWPVRLVLRASTGPPPT